MKNTDKSRAEFEAAFVEEQVRLCGEGFRGSAIHMIYLDTANVQAARWAWQASRQALRVNNPFPVLMGDPDAAWARQVAEKSLTDQGLKVVG